MYEIQRVSKSESVRVGRIGVYDNGHRQRTENGVTSVVLEVTGLQSPLKNGGQNFDLLNHMISQNHGHNNQHHDHEHNHQQHYFHGHNYDQDHG